LLLLWPTALVKGMRLFVGPSFPSHHRPPLCLCIMQVDGGRAWVNKTSQFTCCNYYTYSYACCHKWLPHVHKYMQVGLSNWGVWDRDCSFLTSNLQSTVVSVSKKGSLIITINLQVLRLVGDGYRLSPPPGCPRAVYKLMAQCWWVAYSHIARMDTHSILACNWRLRGLLVRISTGYQLILHSRSTCAFDDTFGWSLWTFAD